MDFKKQIIWIIAVCLRILIHFRPVLSDCCPDTIRIQTTGYPVHVFSSLNDHCEAPCEINLNGERKIVLLSEQSSLLSRPKVECQAMDFGIVHLPSRNVPSSIEVPFPIRSKDYRLGVFCDNNFDTDCSVITDQEKGSFKKIWKNSDYPDEDVIDIILAPDRKHYLIITEHHAFQKNVFTSKILIRLGNVIDSESQLIQIPPEGQFSFATPWLDTRKYDYFFENKNSGWFSGDSMWFSIPYCIMAGKFPLDQNCFTRIINVQNPTIFHDLDSGSEPYHCNWHGERPWLLCRASDEINVAKLVGNDLTVYRHAVTQIQVRIGYLIDWFGDFIAPVGSGRTSLYDPVTGQLARQLEGNHVFLYSPAEKLLITSGNSTLLENSKKREEKPLFFYDENLELQGSKKYVYDRDSKLIFFEPVPSQLSGLYDFLLSHPSQEIDDFLIVNHFGLDYEPERKYVLMGNWLAVVTFPEPFMNYPNFEMVKEIFNVYKKPCYCSGAIGCNNESLVNSISDYYFFPKPEVQE